VLGFTPTLGQSGVAIIQQMHAVNLPPNLPTLAIKEWMTSWQECQAPQNLQT